MTQQICAYCKEAKPATREHLFPASLHKRLLAANGQKENAFWLARLQRTIASEPQIRDVCTDCNSVVLSELDSYICRFFDETLVNMPARHERVRFNHDYHFLKRWLLKICYNSSRIHNSVDRFALEAMCPYILGNNDDLGRSCQLFIQLQYPEEIPDKEVPDDFPANRPLTIFPDVNRVGHIFFQAHGVGRKLLRAVHLRAFTFYLALYEKPSATAQQNFFARVFTSRMSGATLLHPSDSEIRVVCDGVGAWTSFKTSQSTSFT